MKTKTLPFTTPLQKGLLGPICGTGWGSRVRQKAKGVCGMKYGTLCPGVPLPCPNVMATDQARATRMALWIVSCAGTEPRGQLGT